MIYIETKDEMVTPAEQQDEIEEPDSDKDAESTDSEGQDEQPENQDNVFKETYWRRLGRPMPREIKV